MKEQLSQENLKNDWKKSDEEFQEKADTINKNRTFKEKILGRNKTSGIELAHDEAIEEDKKITEDKKFVKGEWIKDERKRKIHQINHSEKDKSNKLFREITEVVIPELPEGNSEIIYSQITGGLLRFMKYKDTFYIKGHNNTENLKKLADDTVERLKTEYPNMKFEVDSW